MMGLLKWKKAKKEPEAVHSIEGNTSEKNEKNLEFNDTSSIYSVEALQYTGLRTRFELTRRKEVGRQHSIEKPWLENKKNMKADKWSYRIFLGIVILGIIGMCAGIALMLLPAFQGPKYCLILDENFSNGLNKNVWTHERQVRGFYTNEFEWLTDSANNSFVENGILYIVPTYTSDAFGNDPNVIFNGKTLNLTQEGVCTAAQKTDTYCAAHSNATLGTVLPPIQSARLTTNLSHTIQFGKVEVKARMPTGDYIWPSIRLEPSQNVYGEFPASGEISIFEGRGNQATKQTDQMNNARVSGLHWGPVNLPAFDRFKLTSGIRTLTRKLYDQTSHTFGIEWTEDSFNIYEENKVRSVYSYKPRNNFWKLGNFPQVVGNTTLEDPWANASNTSTTTVESKMAPFDQQFYLSIGVGVGGTSGWFPDSVYPSKPWSDSQPKQAAGDFWQGRADWQKTWPTDVKQRGMAIESVKIWKTC